MFCSARDDADGHFECDRDGNRVCLEGFRNASTDCTECVPAAGCCKEIKNIMHATVIYISWIQYMEFVKHRDPSYIHIHKSHTLG